MDWKFVWDWLVKYAPVVFTGLIVPAVVSFLNRGAVGARAKFMVAMFTSLLGGVAVHLSELSFITVDAVLGTGVIVFTESQFVYRMFFKDTTLEKRIEGVKT